MYSRFYYTSFSASPVNLSKLMFGYYSFWITIYRVCTLRIESKYIGFKILYRCVLIWKNSFQNFSFDFLLISPHFISLTQSYLNKFTGHVNSCAIVFSCAHILVDNIKGHLANSGGPQRKSEPTRIHERVRITSAHYELNLALVGRSADVVIIAIIFNTLNRGNIAADFVTSSTASLGH